MVALPARAGPVMGAPLTARQARIALSLARGRTQKEVAAEIGVNKTTIVRNLAIARRKAGARTTPQLVAMVALARERDRLRRELAEAPTDLVKEDAL